MSVSPTLTTSRLKLRPIREDDAQSIFDYAKNPHVLRYTTAPTPVRLADTIPFVMDVAHKPNDAYAWGMCLHDSDRVFGVIECSVREDVGSVDYGMAEEFWNRGLMTEAVGAVIDWAFAAYPNMAEMRTAAMAENLASRRVMEKCGFTYVNSVQKQWPKFPQPVTLAVYVIARNGRGGLSIP